MLSLAGVIRGLPGPTNPERGRARGVGGPEGGGRRGGFQAAGLGPPAAPRPLPRQIARAGPLSASPPGAGRGARRPLPAVLSALSRVSPGVLGGDLTGPTPSAGLAGFPRNSEWPGVERGTWGACAEQVQPRQPVRSPPPLAQATPRFPNGPDRGRAGRRHQRLGRQLPPEPGPLSPQGECPVVLEGVCFNTLLAFPPKGSALPSSPADHLPEATGRAAVLSPGGPGGGQRASGRLDPLSPRARWRYL